MAEYNNIATVSGDWYWVQKSTTENGAGRKLALIFPVAVWAETNQGEVVGLVGNTTATTKDGVSRLVEPPNSTEGIYIKRQSSNKNILDDALSGEPITYDLIKDL